MQRFWSKFKNFVLPHLPKRLRHRAIAQLPSRLYMQTDLLPAIAVAGCRRMLFVGVRAYNLGFYRDCARFGMSIWSVDYEADAAVYGAPDGHFTGDIRDIGRLAQGLSFDVIIYNGILGFGINTAQASLEALDAMASVADAGALLVVGWNPGRTDGQEIEAMRQRLVPTKLGSLSAATEFPPEGLQDYTHRYEIFRFPA